MYDAKTCPTPRIPTKQGEALPPLAAAATGPGRRAAPRQRGDGAPAHSRIFAKVNLRDAMAVLAKAELGS